MNGFLLSLAAILMLIEADLGLDARIRNDPGLVVPGRGAAGINLDSSAAEVLKAMGVNRPRVSKPKQMAELFRDVFKVESTISVHFDEIYYFDQKNCAVFLYHKRVRAVALSRLGYTVDSVDLSKGVDFFLLSFGNEGLTVMGTQVHRIYGYMQRGIAIADDESDDTIDLVIVFVPGK